MSKEGAWRYTVPISGRRRFKTYYVCEVGHEHRTERAALRCSAKALVAIRREIADSR